MKRLDQDVAPVDEDGAWQEAIKGIKKIPQKEEKPQPPLIVGKISPKLNYAEVYSGAPLQPLALGNIDNIDRRTAEKFKRGEFAIERRLDLHGMTEKEAFAAVDEFVRKAYMQKCRCLLIVTGKGLNREDDAWYEKKGILKDCVPNWLNGPELRPLILSICYAQPEDGGTGAIYVLLRSRRTPVKRPEAVRTRTSITSL